MATFSTLFTLPPRLISTYYTFLVSLVCKRRVRGCIVMELSDVHARSFCIIFILDGQYK